MKISDQSHCLFARIYLGLGYIGVSWAELLGTGTVSPYMAQTVHRSADYEIQTTIAMLMLAMIGSWLVLGIRSRVMALLGLSLMLATAWSNQYLDTSLAWTIYAASSAVMTVPLVRHGGGRFALARGGWRGLV